MHGKHEARRSGEILSACCATPFLAEAHQSARKVRLPLHGAQQGCQCFTLIGCNLQPPPLRIEAMCQCRQRPRSNVHHAAPSPLQAIQQRFGVAQQSADIARGPGAPLDRGGRRRSRPRSAASSPAREQDSADRSRCWFGKASSPRWSAAVRLFLQRRAGPPCKASLRRRKAEVAPEQLQLVRRRDEDGQRHGAAAQVAARTVCCAAT